MFLFISFLFICEYLFCYKQDFFVELSKTWTISSIQYIFFIKTKDIIILHKMTL